MTEDIMDEFSQNVMEVVHPDTRENQLDIVSNLIRHLEICSDIFKADDRRMIKSADSISSVIGLTSPRFPV